MLDAELPIPLLRYQTGDVIRLLDPDVAAAALHKRNVQINPSIPRQLVAIHGRQRERLPNGAHVLAYKDGLYANPAVARNLSGAFRLGFTGTECTMHVQLRPDTTAEGIEQPLFDALPPAVRPARLVLWPYREFPFGMTLDYERKFKHVEGWRDRGSGIDTGDG
jgi:phenylacetate-CoA ligase